MLQLLRIVERCRVVRRSLTIARLRNVERGEGVHGHKGGEVHAVARASEHVLVEHKVGTEKKTISQIP